MRIQSPDSKPRVAHVVADVSNLAAGTTYSVLTLASALRQEGLSVNVHSLRSSEKEAIEQAITYHRSGLFARLGVSKAMRRGLCGIGADVLHNHGLWMMPNVYAARASRRHEIPLVLSPRGMLSPWAMRRSRIKKAFAWWCLSQRKTLMAVDCFHATSAREAEDIRRLGFFQPVAVIPNGVVIPTGTFGRSARLGRTMRRVLFLSRIHPKKGIPYLLRAWRQVQGKHGDCELVIAGPDDGGYLSEMQCLAQALRLDRISFVGPAYGRQKEELFASADLFVLPTHDENFGNVIAEALAHRLPVITTTGAPWQELSYKRCGWSVELDVDQLAESVSLALDLSPGELAAMGERGRSWMAASFSWQQVARDMHAVYDWICFGGRSPQALVR